MESVKKGVKLAFSKIAYLGSQTPIKRSNTAQKIYLSINEILNHRILNYQTETEYNGFKFRVNPSEFVGRAIYIQDGTYEEEVDQLIDEEISKGDQVLDIGANIGVHTVKIADIVGKSGAVYAFEPDSINREHLTENINLNELENVEIIGKACSNQDGETEIRRFEENWGASSLKNRSVRDNPDKIENVETIKVSTFMRERNLSAEFVKIDVEGLERKVIEGIDSELENIEKIFVELHQDANDDDDLKEIFQILNSEGTIFTLEKNKVEDYRELRNLDDLIWKSK